MKRFFIYLTALTILASCTEKVAPAPTPAPGYKTITLKAVAGQPVSSKTSLNITGDEGIVEWVKEDEILVVDEGGNTGKLTAKNAGALTTFEGTVSDDFGTIQHAFYPAGAFDKESLDTTNGTITLKLNDSSNNFDNIASNPSYAYVAGKGEATFNNICGILCIPITIIGSAGIWYTPTSITLASNNTEDRISGSFTFDYGTFNSTSSNLSPKSTSESVTKITKIPSSWKKNSKTYFYFPVPAGSFASGFSINVPYYDGNHIVETTKNYSIVISQITPMSTLYWKEKNDGPVLTTEY